MSEAARNLVSVPTLEDLAREPMLAASLTPDVRLALAMRCAGVMTALQLTATVAPVVVSADDELLGIEEFAEVIGVSRSWIEKNIGRLPPARLLGSRKRWRRGDINAWVKTR